LFGAPAVESDKTRSFMEEVVQPFDLIELFWSDTGEPHTPVSEIPLGYGLPQDQSQLLMTLIQMQLLIHPVHGVRFPFQPLEKIAIGVQEHPGHVLVFIRYVCFCKSSVSWADEKAWDSTLA
jgi:hypothetical protein